MNDTKRALTPLKIVEWIARDNDGAIEKCGFQIVDADGFLVSTSTLEDEDEATLLLIVRAVNSHEQLVAALRETLAEAAGGYEHGTGESAEGLDWYQRASAALAAAEA